MADKTASAVLIGVIVGLTWALASWINSPLSIKTTAIIVGSFAGMLFSLGYAIYERAGLDEMIAFRAELKAIERDAKRKQQEFQRVQQRAAIEMRMTQLSEMTTPSDPLMGAYPSMVGPSVAPPSAMPSIASSYGPPTGREAEP